MTKHKEQSVLRKEIEDAHRLVTVGATYQHYKDQEKVYTVLGFGFLEATDELCVIYQAQYGEKISFVRPLSIWREHVEWQGNMTPRFRPV